MPDITAVVLLVFGLGFLSGWMERRAVRRAVRADRFVVALHVMRRCRKEGEEWTALGDALYMEITGEVPLE